MISFLQADARAIPLADASVDCCVTSPPYWGLRDYGNPAQLGLEPTPEEYVANMVAVFREVRRVLKADGTLWLNLGDSYTGPKGNTRGEGAGGGKERGEAIGFGKALGKTPVPVGLKPKNLVGIPWRVAFALQADSWYLRQDIIWHKPNPMPESVRDRCTKAHEYVFLMSKNQRYYYDAEAVKEKATDCSPRPPKPESKYAGHEAKFALHSGFMRGSKAYLARNRRSVWTIATQPYKAAHFATFPVRLVEPCILAGCRPGGIVFDPFTGAGTVAIACLMHGRHFVGTEINPEYLKLAQTRIAEWRPAKPKARRDKAKPEDWTLFPRMAGGAA